MADSSFLWVATVTFSWRVSGKTIGRMESELGHIGVIVRLSTVGWTIGPPAESECAVEPVGVATIMPSALNFTTLRLLISRSSLMSRAKAP